MGEITADRSEVNALQARGFRFESRDDGVYAMHDKLGLQAKLPCKGLSDKANIPKLHQLMAEYGRAEHTPTEHELCRLDSWQPDWRDYLPESRQGRSERERTLLAVCEARGQALLARIAECDGICLGMDSDEAGQPKAYIIRDSRNKQGLGCAFGEDPSQPIMIGLRHGAMNKPSVARLERLLEALLRRDSGEPMHEPLLADVRKIDALYEQLTLSQGRGRG